VTNKVTFRLLPGGEKKVLTENKPTSKRPKQHKARRQNKKNEGTSERTSKAENTQRRKHQGKKKRERREKKTLDCPVVGAYAEMSPDAHRATDLCPLLLPTSIVHTSPRSPQKPRAPNHALVICALYKLELTQNRMIQKQLLRVEAGKHA
jgi:hypothetical protein